MNNQFHILKRFLLILCSGIVCSCNSWLDLKPSDSITEEELLSTKEGFYQALNGIYLDLNKDELYGATLLCRDVEILAQRYTISPNNKNYTTLGEYAYKDQYPKETFQQTWNTAYNLILSANKLLQNANEKKEMLGDDYDLIYGELLGLRAMLHFDLFRLFGPVLALNPHDKAIPYNTQPKLVINDILTADSVVSCLITDLNAAEKALQKDPILDQGPLFSEGENNNTRFRTLRLNYYAVKGLQARVYLYAAPLKASYRQKAYDAATSVIQENETKKWFSFVNSTEIHSSNPDRIFSTEILFMNQNNHRVTIFQDYFDPAVSDENILAPDDETLSNLYAEKDYRYFPLWQTSPEKSYRCLYKYANVKNNRSNDMIPMIRLSEMYLIAAETAPSPEEGLEYFNRLLPNRGIGTLDPGSDLEEALRTEYRREFFAEGQLFFFYKRKNLSYIPLKSDMPWDAKYVTPEVYVVPLPDSEIMYH